VLRAGCACQPYAAFPSNERNAQLAVGRAATAGNRKERQCQCWATREVRGGKRERARGPGHGAGLALVPHPGALAVELLKGAKSSPPLAAMLPENPAERISFRFSSRAFAVVFHGREEQNPGAASWLLPGSPLPGCWVTRVAASWTVLCRSPPWSRSMERTR